MKNPVKNEKGSFRVLRGGEDIWSDDARISLRVEAGPSSKGSYSGFRLVKNIPKDKK